MANRHFERVTFTGSQGAQLAGRLELPDGEPCAVGLFAHCFTCGADVVAASRISAGLVARGMAVLRFDFTGLGSSEGDFANTDFSSNVADLVAAADMLRDRYRAPSVLVGHSLGGAAVLSAASLIPEVAAVVTLAAPSDPAHVTGLLGESTLDVIRTEGNAEVTLAGRSFTVRREFLDDISTQRLEESIRGLDAALLVLHSPVDQIVGVDHARRIYQAARHPKSFVALDGADHMLTRPDDAAYVAGLVAAWVSKYLPDGHGPASAVSPVSAGDPVSVESPGDRDPGGAGRDPLPAGRVVVSESGPGTYTQRVLTGTHELLADEPIGTGDDQGPSPYDLLLAGLGACTSMTLRMYAQRRDLPLEHVSVTLDQQRIHAEDCVDLEGRPCRITEIRTRIELTGDLDDAQRDKLAYIAGRCPVHRTLTGEIRIETELVEPRSAEASRDSPG